MPSSTWKHIGIAFATLAALSISASVLWFLYGNALVPVERLLPARTAILVSGADATALRWLRTWVPQIPADLALTPQSTLAVIPEGDGFAWVTLTPTPGLRGIPYTIEGSSPQAKALVRRYEETLEQNDVFDTLSADRALLHPWAYVNTPLLGSGAFVSPMPWMRLTAPLALSAQEDAFSLSLFDEHSLPLATFSSSVRTAFPDPLFIGQTHESGFWDRLKSQVDPAFLLLSQSTVIDLFKQTMGKEASYTYDFAPLLSEQTIVQMARAASGSQLLFLLEGEMHRGDEERLETLLTSFESSIPALRRETVTFREGFTSDTIAQDEEVLEQRETTMDGWQVRSLQHLETGHALSIATKGSAFLLSNDPKALEARVAERLPTLSWHTIHGTILASGLLNRSVALATLQPLLGPAMEPTVMFPPKAPELLQWSVLNQRKRLTLRFEFPSDK